MKFMSGDKAFMNPCVRILEEEDESIDIDDEDEND
jgi:hypothetical protein